MRGVNRRKRTGMWIAGLAAIAATAATYRLTRTPELVWWTSPPLGSRNRHIQALVPSDWEMDQGYNGRRKGKSPMAWYIIRPVEHRPTLLRWLSPRQPDGGLAIGVTDIQFGRKSFGYLDENIRLWAYSGPYG